MFDADKRGTDGRRTLEEGKTAAVAIGLTDRAGINPGLCFKPGEDCISMGLLEDVVIGRDVEVVRVEGVWHISDNRLAASVLLLLLPGLVILLFDETGATSHCECSEAWFMASSDRVEGVLDSSEMVLWYVFCLP